MNGSPSLMMNRAINKSAESAEKAVTIRMRRTPFSLIMLTWQPGGRYL